MTGKPAIGSQSSSGSFNVTLQDEDGRVQDITSGTEIVHRSLHVANSNSDSIRVSHADSSQNATDIVSVSTPHNRTVISATGCTSTGADSLATGNLTTASGDGSFAGGFSTTSSGPGSASFGLGTTSTSQGSFATGLATNATQIGTAGFGSFNSATGNNCMVMGDGNTSGGRESFVGGKASTGTANANRSFLMGNLSTMNAANSMGVGSVISVNGENSFIGGKDSSNSASDENTFSWGINNISTGTGSNNVTGIDQLSKGFANTISGQGHDVSGTHNLVTNLNNTIENGAGSVNVLNGEANTVKATSGGFVFVQGKDWDVSNTDVHLIGNAPAVNTDPNKGDEIFFIHKKETFFDGSSITAPVKGVSGAYTLVQGDYTVVATDATAQTITLPDASTCEGRLYHIKQGGTGAVTVDTSSGQTIDGVTSINISTYAGSLVTNPTLKIQAFNSNWIIL